jgi:hypothetical protein
MSTTTTSPAAVTPRNGLGIASFVCGLTGAVAGLIPILAIPALAAGLTGFGLGLAARARLHRRTADNTVMTWFGLGLSLLAVVLGVVGFVIVEHAFSQLGTPS